MMMLEGREPQWKRFPSSSSALRRAVIEMEHHRHLLARFFFFFFFNINFYLQQIPKHGARC